MLPPGFEEIDDEDLDLYYRVEPDGSVLIAGERKRCILRVTLPDGSRLQGGINANGMLFGDRTMNGRTFPLKWQDPVTAARPGTRLQPTESRTDKSTGLRKGIHDSVFDNPLLGKPPRQVTPPPPPSKKLPEPQVLEDIGSAAASAAKRIRKGSGDKSGVSIETLEEVAAVIEQTQREVAQVREDNAKAFEQTHQLAAENTALRAELDRVRAEAKARLIAQEIEWKRKVATRRWSVEELHATDLTVEGLEARAWEVEDQEGAIQYLVVATVPSGTAESVVKQWMDDLKSRVDLMPFGGRAVYITKRENTKLEVLELLPGVDAQVVESSAQF